MVIAEECHVVNATPPIDINSSGATSDYFSLEGYGHATIICTLGVVGASTTITVEESDDLSGSNTTAIDFAYYAEETAAGDTLADRTTVGDTGGIDSSTNNSIMYVIEIDADELTDGYPCLVVKASDPSSATLYNCTVILSEPRYAEENTPTAIE